MNLKGFADIDFFLQQLAMLKTGSAVETSIVVTGLRRILTHVKSKSKDAVTMYVHRLNQSSAHPNGWEGMASDDEYYDCHPSNQTRTGVSVVVRDKDNRVLRAAVFCLSSDLANEIFGVTPSYEIELSNLPADASILNETALDKLEGSEEVEEAEVITEDAVTDSEEKEDVEVDVEVDPPTVPNTNHTPNQPPVQHPNKNQKK